VRAGLVVITAAVLAADVFGYSRLMGADEEGTLAALKTCRREIIDPKIAEHRGRVVKTTGDGVLVAFASAVDAVRCAVEIQRTMAERNANIPEDSRIILRIGINVGDIIIDEGDIYGDGVNTAARVPELDVVSIGEIRARLLALLHHPNCTRAARDPRVRDGQRGNARHGNQRVRARLQRSRRNANDNGTSCSVKRQLGALDGTACFPVAIW
jgi:class 3 adenylate cyclase